MKNFIWNYQDKTIRGWFVNLVITMTILMLVVIGAFNEEVKTNLKDLSFKSHHCFLKRGSSA